jgi:hypothetical protein
MSARLERFVILDVWLPDDNNSKITGQAQRLSHSVG